MRFEIKRSLLDTALQNVSKGLSTKTPMPILMGVQLTAKNNELIFITTNKEISVRVVIKENDDLKIDEEGSCVVPGKYFVDIVKKIDGEFVDFTLFDESTIKILSKNSDFTLIAYEKDNFPNTNFDIESESITLSCKDLKQIVRQTSFACSSSESRITLTSINFLIKDDLLTVTATDSFRLAKRIMKIENVKNKMQINIPSKSLEEFTKIINDSNDLVELVISNNVALFKYKNISFLTRLVEGIYPDTSSLYPKSFMFSMKFNREMLIAAVDRASLFMESNPNLSFVKFNMTANNKIIEVSSNSSEIGRVVETIEALEVSENSDFQIAFSAKYLIEALKSFDTKEISIYCTGEVKPAIITSAELPELTQLLLPVRVF